MKELPEGWELKPLSYIASYINGRAFKPSEWESDGLPIIRIQNLTDQSKPFNYYSGDYDVSNYIDDGDILISWSASLGVFEWNRGPAILNQHIFKVYPNYNILDKKYFLYAMDRIINLMTSRIHGSTMKHITKSDFLRLEILLPPLPIQRRIATILDKADTLRQKSKKVNKLADKFLQSRYLEMFGDPVKNPKRWEMVSINDLSTKIGSGSTPKGGKEIYLEEGIFFIRSQNVRMNELTFDDIVYIDEKIHNDMTRTKVKPKDVLLNITGASIGRVCLVPDEIIDANVNQHVCIIRPIKTKITSEYFSFTISMPSFQLDIISRQSGATRQAFNFKQIGSFQIPIPPLSLQKKFTSIIEQFKRIERNNIKKKNEINNLFYSLLQRAFTGEFTVKWEEEKIRSY